VTASRKVPMVVPGRARQHAENRASVSFAFVSGSASDCKRNPRFSAAGLRRVNRGSTSPRAGLAVLVVADGDAELARQECARLAAEVWQRRRDYLARAGGGRGRRCARCFGSRRRAGHPSDSADATPRGRRRQPGCCASCCRYDWPRPALVSAGRCRPRRPRCAGSAKSAEFYRSVGGQTRSPLLAADRGDGPGRASVRRRAS